VLVNEAMPSLETSTLINRLSTEASLVLMARNDKEIDVARQALMKAGFNYRPVTQREFGPSGATFQVVIGDVSNVGDPTP